MEPMKNDKWQMTYGKSGSLITHPDQGHIAPRPFVLVRLPPTPLYPNPLNHYGGAATTNRLLRSLEQAHDSQAGVAIG